MRPKTARLFLSLTRSHLLRSLCQCTMPSFRAQCSRLRRINGRISEKTQSPSPVRATTAGGRLECITNDNFIEANCASQSEFQRIVYVTKCGCPGDRPHIHQRQIGAIRRSSELTKDNKYCSSFPSHGQQFFNMADGLTSFGLITLAN